MAEVSNRDDLCDNSHCEDIVEISNKVVVWEVSNNDDSLEVSL